MSLKVETFTEPGMQENTYVFYDTETKEGVVIDPCGDNGSITSFISDNKIKIMSILLTHGHYDHIESVDKIKQLSNAPIAAHKDELPILSNHKMNFSKAICGKVVELEPDVLFNGESEITFSGHTINVIHTPGHTPGGVCYYSKEAGVLFTGDTLFKDSVGRTDFPLGNGEVLFASINEKLFVLPDDVVCYPGHMSSTSIGYEKKNNPFVR